MQKRKITKSFATKLSNSCVTYAAHLVISIIVSYFYKDQIDNASISHHSLWMRIAHILKCWVYFNGKEIENMKITLLGFFNSSSG